MLLNQIEKLLWNRLTGDVIENLMQALLEPSIECLVARFFRPSGISLGCRLPHCYMPSLQDAIMSAKASSWHLDSAAAIPPLTRRLG